MNIKNVAILGAGAIGCYMLWGLDQKENLDICIVAEGARKERIEAEGLTINGKIYKPVVKTPQEANGADILFIATKYDALTPSLKDIRAVCDDHTIVMSLMNGVESEDIIATVIPKNQIVHSVIKVQSTRVGSNVTFNPETCLGVIYGQADGDLNSEKMLAINELFTGSGLHYRAAAHIESEIWNKFKLNVSSNLVQSILSVGVGAYTDSKYLNQIRNHLKAEVDAVAAAKGIDMNLADKSTVKQTKVFKTARYSTLQDLDAGRHTEIEMLAGAVVRMGKELGVATPYNEMTYYLIKAIEEKNDGLFNYNSTDTI